MKKVNYLNFEFTLNDNSRVIIIEYNSYINCTIQFDDGRILKNIRICNLKNGEVKYPVDYNGMLFITRQGYEAKIIKHIDSNRNTIQFNDERCTILENIPLGNLRKGRVNNPYHPTAYEVGYLGIGKYKSNERIGETLKSTKHYSVWFSMLTRCYSKNMQKDYPTYIGCSVDKKWHNFQVFAEWFEENYNPDYMKKWQLDKDILFEGNKIYSPETCRLVPKDINTLLVIPANKKSNLPTGVSLDKPSGKYITELSKYGKKYKIGRSLTAEEAFQIYRIAKEDYIKEVASLWKGLISEDIYKKLLSVKIVNRM